MKKQYILSCILGGTFFAVPYLALNISALPAAAIGIAAYGAGTLLFKDRTKIDLTDDITIQDKEDLKRAKDMVNKLKEISTKLKDRELVKNTKEICITSDKIIDTVIERPEKIKKIRNFLNYYLPVTTRILERYDEIENQKLTTAETKRFMTSVEEMIAKIKTAFEQQLSNIYQTEMIDTDAELKVFETMLKSDGFIQNVDFSVDDSKGKESIEAVEKINFSIDNEDRKKEV